MEIHLSSQSDERNTSPWALAMPCHASPDHRVTVGEAKEKERALQEGGFRKGRARITRTYIDHNKEASGAGAKKRACNCEETT